MSSELLIRAYHDVTKNKNSNLIGWILSMTVILNFART